MKIGTPAWHDYYHCDWTTEAWIWTAGRGINGSPDAFFTNLLIFFNDQSTHFNCLFISTSLTGVVTFFSSTILLISGNKRLAIALDCGVSCLKHAAVNIDADTRSSAREMLYTEKREAAITRSLSGWRTWREWISQRPAFGVRMMLYFA